MTYRELTTMTEDEYVEAYNANQTDPDDIVESLDEVLEGYAGQYVRIEQDFEDENGEWPETALSSTTTANSS
ncbi:hypothetical protein [Salidesulfovibrio brasiliensis]|uniref:hypothetical protein n=1 Tax=Salidesulfovibrio brasiliensis TaxID=221711 RepID=UPI0006CFE677